MINLLADANIQGQVAYLVRRMQSQAWRDFWDYLQLRHITFDEVGLSLADSDVIVWRRCQEQELLLLTDNRNDDGPDSLEATIRAHNTARTQFAGVHHRQRSGCPFQFRVCRAHCRSAVSLFVGIRQHSRDRPTLLALSL